MVRKVWALTKKLQLQRRCRESLAVVMVRVVMLMLWLLLVLR
jgi:hypothetical protein